MQTKLVTSAYYNIKGYPHYGAERAGRIKLSLPNIAQNTNLPIVCYTSKKYGCYDELQEILQKKNITNVTLKIFELEYHPLHQKVLDIRMVKDNEHLRQVYEWKPIIVYWSKFMFLLNELENSDYVYWIDSGLSHNGLFPKRYAIGNLLCFGMGECDSTFNFSCFSKDVFDKINNFTQNKVLHMVRPVSDADVGAVVTTPELQQTYLEKEDIRHFWPIGGFFGGHATNSSLKLYLEKVQEICEILVKNNRITVDEGIMAYVDVVYSEWFKFYHFENFYTEDEKNRDLHWRLDKNGVEDGTIFHHFYRMFCDEGPLVDHLGHS